MKGGKRLFQTRDKDHCQHICITKNVKRNFSSKVLMILDRKIDTCKGECKKCVDIYEILFSCFYMMQKKHLVKFNTICDTTSKKNGRKENKLNPKLASTATTKNNQCPT